MNLTKTYWDEEASYFKMFNLTKKVLHLLEAKPTSKAGLQHSWTSRVRLYFITKFSRKMLYHIFSLSVKMVLYNLRDTFWKYHVLLVLLSQKCKEINLPAYIYKAVCKILESNYLEALPKWENKEITGRLRSSTRVELSQEINQNVHNQLFDRYYFS